MEIRTDCVQEWVDDKWFCSYVTSKKKKKKRKNKRSKSRCDLISKSCSDSGRQETTEIPSRPH